MLQLSSSISPLETEHELKSPFRKTKNGNTTIDIQKYPQEIFQLFLTIKDQTNYKSKTYSQRSTVYEKDVCSYTT